MTDKNSMPGASGTLEGPGLSQWITARAKDAQLTEFVDLGKQRVTEFTSGFLLELPVKDPLRTADVERLIRSLQNELRDRGIELQAVLRPVWKIEDVLYLGPAIGAEGTPRTAIAFQIPLSWGVEKAEAIVNVTIAAIDIIRDKLGIGENVNRFGWSPRKGDITEGLLKQAVRIYVQSQLEGDAEQFWDPVRKPIPEFDGSAALALFGETTSFRDLRRAIQDALTGPTSAGFLSDLKRRGFSVQQFRNVLPELSSFFGGAFSPRDRFLTSAVDLYERLRPAEQELLRSYFDELVQASQST